MGKSVFFGKLVKSSLLHRKSRVLVAIVSVVLGISLASAMLNISYDVGERFGSTLTGYGANILLVPKETTLNVGVGGIGFGALSAQGHIRESELTQIEEAKSSKYLVAYAPSLYAVVDMNGQKVLLSGVWFDSLLKVNPSWKLSGKSIAGREDARSAVAGVNVAERQGLRLGDGFEIEYEGRTVSLILVGIISSGGSEDNQILVSLLLAQEITSKAGLVHTVQLSYTVRKVELMSVAQELEGAIPSASAKIIRQVAEAEETFLEKMQTVMTVLVAGVLAASTFAVTGTLSTTTMERRKEIGLMLALGASGKKVIQLFLTEAIAIGLVGGLVGYLLGLGLAAVTWMQVFGVAILPRPTTLPAVLVLAVGVTLIASVIPVRQALKVNPSVTLRAD